MAVETYELNYADNVWMQVAIDRDICTDEKLLEINSFWSGAEQRLSRSAGSPLKAVLKMLGTAVARETIQSFDAKDAFDWSKGRGVEGWPALDGSHGITLLDFNEYTFDEDEVHVSLLKTTEAA
jgi:hypothetical protein